MTLRFWANFAAEKGFTAFEEGELLNCEGNDEKFIFWYCNGRRLREMV